MDRMSGTLVNNKPGISKTIRQLLLAVHITNAVLITPKNKCWYLNLSKFFGEISSH